MHSSVAAADAISGSWRMMLAAMPFSDLQLVCANQPLCPAPLSVAAGLTWWWCCRQTTRCCGSASKSGETLLCGC